MAGYWTGGTSALVFALNQIIKDSKSIDFNVSTSGSVTANVISNINVDFTTEDSPLSGVFFIDGFTVENKNTILITNKGVLNGIYEVNSGNLTRFNGFNNNENIKNGSTITVNKTGEIFTVNFDGDYIEGSTIIKFNKINPRLPQKFEFIKEDFIDDVNLNVSISFNHYFKHDSLICHIFDSETSQEIEAEVYVNEHIVKIIIPNEPIELRFNGFLLVEEVL